MRQMHARGVAGLVPVVQNEGLSNLQRDLALGELADAQLRPLKVGENADRPPHALFDGPDTLDQIAHQVMAGMAHIDAEDVGAGLVHLADHLLGGGGGPQCRQNLDPARALHCPFPSVTLDVSGVSSIGAPSLSTN